MIVNALLNQATGLVLLASSDLGCGPSDEIATLRVRVQGPVFVHLHTKLGQCQNARISVPSLWYFVLAKGWSVFLEGTKLSCVIGT